MAGMLKWLPLLLGLFVVVTVLGLLLKVVGWIIGALLVVAVIGAVVVRGAKKDG
jgi:hypothetical protein